MEHNNAVVLLHNKTPIFSGFFRDFLFFFRCNVSGFSKKVKPRDGVAEHLTIQSKHFSPRLFHPLKR